MKQVKLGNVETSVIGMGCMRLASLSQGEADALIHTAAECGVTFFDHADIYGRGRSEELFGGVLKNDPGLRDRILVQSKCGIRPDCYDFSYDHIMESVEGSLRRLQTDYLDCLLFHRPDVLAEEKDFARAVQELKRSGKVRRFGVSNMNPAQIRLLQDWSGEKMTANQMQLSLMHAGMVTSGMNVNMDSPYGVMQDGSVLPYCRRKEITLQAWSPLQYGMFGGCFVGNEQFPELNRELNRLAEQYGVTPAAIAIAWILRIPGRTQVILGTTDPEHMRRACEAEKICLTRPEWYGLCAACGYPRP